MQRDLFDLLTCPVCRDSELTGVDDASGGWRAGLLALRRRAIRCGTAFRSCCRRTSTRPACTTRSTTCTGTATALRTSISRPTTSIAASPKSSRSAGRTARRRRTAGCLPRSSAAASPGLPDLRGATVVDVVLRQRHGRGDAGASRRARDRDRYLRRLRGAGRARARERYGLDYLVVVGDVEHLPVRTASADISYVHDGLHHLSDPAIGLRELARVARRAISINEPAEALGTALAVKLGVALEREDAGNRVARLRPERRRARTGGGRLRRARATLPDVLQARARRCDAAGVATGAAARRIEAP